MFDDKMRVAYNQITRLVDYIWNCNRNECLNSGVRMVCELVLTSSLKSFYLPTSCVAGRHPIIFLYCFISFPNSVSSSYSSKQGPTAVHTTEESFNQIMIEID